MAARRRTTAPAVNLDEEHRRALPDLRRFAPSLRSILVSVALIVAAGLAYVGARETSVFALRTVDVQGGTPALRAEVRAALSPKLGESLLKVNESTVGHALAGLPGVASFTYDRDFPHTLKLVIRAEQPVLVLRRVPGSEAYLVAASGRILRPLAHPLLSALPRLWVTHDVDVVVGERLAPEVAAAAHVLAPLQDAPLPTGVKTVQLGTQLTLQLGSGFEVRLGDAGDVRLKLAVARRLLRVTGAAVGGTGYLDVSVPVRPVLDTNPQVSGTG